MPTGDEDAIVVMINAECNAADATSTHAPNCEAPQAEGRPKQRGDMQKYINLQRATADERVSHGCFELELAGREW